MTTLTKVRHGEVTLRQTRDDYWVVDVDVDGYQRPATGNLGRIAARDAANRIHKALRNGATPAEAVAAQILLDAEDTARDFAANGYGTVADMMIEAVHGTINMRLGYCPDGCCGGDEVIDDADRPAFAAWRKALWAATEAARNAPGGWA